MAEELYRVAINCRHEIDGDKVVLYFDPSQEGHNALNQLSRRLDAAMASVLSDVTNALRRVVEEPHGCRFCDSGKLRNPDKTHDDDCGFALAAKALK